MRAVMLAVMLPVMKTACTAAACSHAGDAAPLDDLSLRQERVPSQYSRAMEQNR